MFFFFKFKENIKNKYKVIEKITNKSKSCQILTIYNNIYQVEDREWKE